MPAMKISGTMGALVDALSRASQAVGTAAADGAPTAGELIVERAAARDALCDAIVELERQVHDLKNDVFKATTTLELATIEASQNLQQLADALSMPPTSTLQELLTRIVQGNLAGNILEIDRMLDAGKPGAR